MARRKRKWDSPQPKEKTRTEREAKALGVDLRLECPVCRSVKGCDCTEDERAYQRRIRFTEGVKAVPRCEICACPLSCLIAPRPGATPPFELIETAAIYGCANCSGVALATHLVNASRP